MIMPFEFVSIFSDVIFAGFKALKSPFCPYILAHKMCEQQR
tara:strand:+ start:1601 stop:1723 length:123 start_codon:yes stop_codon:yes gene_type:complete